jgi:hypothetical protein
MESNKMEYRFSRNDTVNNEVRDFSDFISYGTCWCRIAAYAVFGLPRRLKLQQPNPLEHRKARLRGLWTAKNIETNCDIPAVAVGQSLRGLWTAKKIETSHAEATRSFSQPSLELNFVTVNELGESFS